MSASARAVALQECGWKSARGPSAAVAPRTAPPWRTLVRTAAARLPSSRRCRAPRVCGCSLFPQEGCPLLRYGREGQDPDANDFGVCVAGPVRPLVAVPLGPSLQHVHKAPTHTPALAHRHETDGEIRGTDASPNKVAPAASAATSGRNGPIFGGGIHWPWFISFSSMSASKHQDCSA